MSSDFRQIFRQSPFISISFLAACWLSIRGFAYQSFRGWFFDIPFVYYSPVRFEYNIADTAILVLLIGEIAAVIALCRKKEHLRYWGVLFLVVNFLAFNRLVGLVVWALAPPPGIDY